MGMFSDNTDQAQEGTAPVAVETTTTAPLYYRHGACNQRTLAGSFTPADKTLPCATCQSCPSATEFTWE